MAEPAVGAPPAPGTNPDAPAKKARREKLIVGGTLLLVVLTYLILRRQSAASNTASSGVPLGVDPNTGIPYAEEYGYGGATGYGGNTATSGYLNPQDPTILALQGQLSTLQGQVTSLEASSPGSSTLTAGSTTTGSSATGSAPGPNTGLIPLPQPQTNNYAGTQAVAATLQPGQSGVLPNGLRVKVTTIGGQPSYTYY